jgi:hypothetical protein
MNEPGDTMAEGQPARGGDGRFIRTPEQAAKDAEAARLRARGMSYPAIARELGYASHSSAVDAVARALADITREPAEELVTIELERLDAILVRMHGVMDSTHYVVSRGEVVEHEGAPLVDDGPVIAAAMAILRIEESRRKLLGLDAETKVSVSGGVRYEIVGVSPDEIIGGANASEDE